MLFVLFRIVETILEPGNLLVLLLALGMLLLAIGWRRVGTTFVALMTAAMVAIAVLPVGEWAGEPLERRFPRPAAPDHIDGIVVLGGAVILSLTRANGEVALNDMAERITATVVLARRYPGVPVVVTGGDTGVPPHGITEADATRRLLVSMGLDEERVLVENRARNTYENAVYSKEIAKPLPGQVWLLVTSANHMPRAMGCFRQAGWEMRPYPVDYNTGSGNGIRASFVGELGLLGYAEHEWIGLVVYRLLGRTNALFPAPASNSETSAR